MRRPPWVRLLFRCGGLNNRTLSFMPPPSAKTSPPWRRHRRYLRSTSNPRSILLRPRGCGSVLPRMSYHRSSLPPTARVARSATVASAPVRPSPPSPLEGPDGRAQREEMGEGRERDKKRRHAAVRDHWRRRQSPVVAVANHSGKRERGKGDARVN